MSNERRNRSHETGDCETCGEGFPAEGDERCSNAKRGCGHHCNCLWTHDVCHWCDAFPDGDGGLTIPERLTKVPAHASTYQPFDDPGDVR